jgi:hypothetical protein
MPGNPANGNSNNMRQFLSCWKTGVGSDMAILQLAREAAVSYVIQGQLYRSKRGRNLHDGFYMYAIDMATNTVALLPEMEQQPHHVLYTCGSVHSDCARHATEFISCVLGKDGNQWASFPVVCSLKDKFAVKMYSKKLVDVVSCKLESITRSNFPEMLYQLSMCVPKYREAMSSSELQYNYSVDVGKEEAMLMLLPVCKRCGKAWYSSPDCFDPHHPQECRRVHETGDFTAMEANAVLGDW